MIKLERVQKHYPGFDLDISMEIPEGRVTGFIGANGAGKSTTFKAILGLIRTDGGKITVLGKPNGEIMSEDREKIGVMLSDSGFSMYLKIGDLIPVLASLYADFDREFFLKKCGEFGLPMNKRLKDFSTGMRAKLKILTAISHEARLLILDEPTAGLDVMAREEILELLQAYMLPGDRSILISSHISGDLEGLCDDIYLIDKGKILLHEETGQILDSYGVLKVSEEEYGKLDKSCLMRRKKESYGWSCLTGERQFYMENNPGIVVEKGGIDEVITLMVKGERV